MELVVVIAISAFLIGCVSTSKWSIYEAESSGSTTEGGVTYYLSIKPQRRDFEVDPIFMAGCSGPPYVVTLHATRTGGKTMKKVQVSRIRIILPDGGEYDVLHGQPIWLVPEDHNPAWVDYRSGKLPLGFREGAKVVVEAHCNAGDGEIVIRKTFVGKKGGATESIWEAYGSCQIKQPEHRTRCVGEQSCNPASMPTAASA
jgi:hypothetical protein